MKNFEKSKTLLIVFWKTTMAAGVFLTLFALGACEQAELASEKAKETIDNVTASADKS